MAGLAERKALRLSLFFAAFFVLIGANLFYLQVIHTDTYTNLSEKNRIRVISLEAPRGRVLDRKGRPLITNRLSFNCSAFTTESQSTIRQTLESLAPLLGESFETLQRRYFKGKPGIYRTIILAEDIPAEKAMAIEERLDSLPGIWIETKPVREYPYKEAAAHLTGYLGLMTEEEEEVLAPEGYLSSDSIGRSGLERAYEKELHGQPGGVQMEVNSRGRFVRALGMREPSDGQEIQLTVDLDLQQLAQKELLGHKGAVVILDLQEGGILSMNSSPSFDPNQFSSTQGRKAVGSILMDPDSPMINRSIGAQYPAGSIFKIVTAMAALGSSRITEFLPLPCHGSLRVGNNTFRCWKESGHGPQTLAEAFAHSCNVYFYSAGILAGIDALDRESVDFGLSQLTGIDLPGEKSGVVPNREWKRRKFGTGWFEGDTANLSIGQGALQITPIQALQMVSVAATGGIRPKIHLLDSLGGEKRLFAPMVVHRNPAHWKAVREGLKQVVASETGTGRLARVPALSIAGKTGTAQSGQAKTHAWFVGYSPAQNPKIAMVVFLEQGGRGGVAAAGLASKMFGHLKAKGYL